MGKIPETARGEREMDSLGVYMRGLNELGEYSAEQQNRLCRSFQQISDELREAVCELGFVPQEYLRFITAIQENGSETADIFLVSAIKELGRNRQEQLDSLQAWKADISDLYSRLQEAFDSGGDCDALRREMANVLKRYRLTLQHIYNSHFQNL